MTWRYLIEIPWIVFLVYWTIGAFKTQRTVRQESFASRYGVLILEIAGFVLLFSERVEIGFLGKRIFPRTYVMAATGVILTWIGIAIALWARYHLGQFWSARITLKEDHKLIRTGPYARLRHPIYTGLDLAAIGSALTIDEWRCVLGVDTDCFRICDQGAAGRGVAARAIWGRLHGALPGDGVFATAVAIRAVPTPEVFNYT